MRMMMMAGGTACVDGQCVDCEQNPDLSSNHECKACDPSLCKVSAQWSRRKFVIFLYFYRLYSTLIYCFDSPFCPQGWRDFLWLSFGGHLSSSNVAELRKPILPKILQVRFKWREWFLIVWLTDLAVQIYTRCRQSRYYKLWIYCLREYISFWQKKLFNFVSKK